MPLGKQSAMNVTSELLHAPTNVSVRRQPAMRTLSGQTYRGGSRAASAIRFRAVFEAVIPLLKISLRLQSDHQCKMLTPATIHHSYLIYMAVHTRTATPVPPRTRKSFRGSD